jgi:hypothetical protein
MTRSGTESPFDGFLRIRVWRAGIGKSTTLDGRDCETAYLRGGIDIGGCSRGSERTGVLDGADGGDVVTDVDDCSRERATCGCLFLLELTNRVFYLCQRTVVVANGVVVGVVVLEHGEERGRRVGFPS